MRLPWNSPAECETRTTIRDLFLALLLAALTFLLLLGVGQWAADSLERPVLPDPRSKLAADYRPWPFTEIQPVSTEIIEQLIRDRDPNLPSIIATEPFFIWGPSPTPTPTPSVTPSPSVTDTETPGPTPTPLPPMDTPLPTETPTRVRITSTPIIPSVTASPTSIWSPPDTATPTWTPVPPATRTPLPTATFTPLPTATWTPLPTATFTPLPTATWTPLPTATFTPLRVPGG